jgi:hypothetical protein
MKIYKIVFEPKFRFKYIFLLVSVVIVLTTRWLYMHKLFDHSTINQDKCTRAIKQLSTKWIDFARSKHKTVIQCVSPIRVSYICLWWIDLRLKQIFATSPAASKVGCFKICQTRLKNNHLATLV